MLDKLHDLVSVESLAESHILTHGDLRKLVDNIVSSERRLSEESIENSVNAFYLLYAGALVFMMQAGFAMLCAGSLRVKNIKNIMLKNLLDACVGAIGFWVCGYGIAYGNLKNVDEISIIGDEWFFLRGDFEKEDSYHSWFFQFAFAATAATIVSGAVAERCQMTAYACYSFFLTAWVYPVMVRMIWGYNGHLSAFRAEGSELTVMNGVGVIDFAGCGVVHMVGGISAMLGAWILGPRQGRFDEKGQIADPMPGHNAALVVLGTFLLWFGWYGFNPGSTLCIHECEAVASKTAVTTTLAAAAGTITNLMLHKWLSGILSLEEACNGALAGLVGITSACSVVDPWAAIVIGGIGSIFYTIGQKTCLKWQIDDPVNASAVHFFAGAWGLMAPGIFAKEANMVAAYGVEGKEGIYYSGEWVMFQTQLLAFLVVTTWVCINMIPFFALLKGMGLFRVSAEVEEMGMDEMEHGGGAYHMTGGAPPAISAPSPRVSRKPPPAAPRNDISDATQSAPAGRPTLEVRKNRAGPGGSFRDDR